MANITKPSIQDLKGKIGIRLSDPKTKLHIGPLTGGDSTAQERLRLSGDYAGTNSGALLRFTNQHNSGSNPNTGEYNLAGIKAYDYRSDWGGALALQTAPNTSSGGTLVDRITILPEGLVGINTTGPTSLLTVNDGNVKLIKGMLSGGTDFDFLQLSFNGGWSGNVGGLAAINFTDSITATNTVGRIGVTYTGSQGKFVITDLYSGGYAASGDAFTIQADGQTYIKGNTGIGTTNATAKLDIVGGGSGVSVRIKGDQPTGTYYYGYMYDGTNLKGTTQTNVFYAGGSVAANTTIVDWASLRIDTPSVGASNAVITNNYGIYQASAAQKNYFGGNVGIGSNAPTTKLDIAGGINATGKNFLNQSNQYNNPTPGVTGFGNKSMDTSISYYDTGKTVATATRGIVWTGKHYIITDYNAQTAKFYDSNFDTMNRPTGGTINLPNHGNTDHPHGAAWDGRYLYCIQYGGSGGKIVAYDLDNGTTTASIMFTKDMNNPGATYDVEYAEGHLYTVTDGAVSKYKLEGNSISHVHTSGNILSSLEAQSITYDGSYLWITQNGNNMYQVRLDCTLKATLTTDIPPENVAMAWNGQNTVSVNHTNGKVYVINTAHTRFDTEQFSIMGGNLGIGISDNPGGDQLHVLGTLRVGPYFSTSDRDFIKLVPHGTDTKIISPNERFHIENLSGNIILTPSGGVGIGTTVPDNPLTVKSANCIIDAQSTADGQTIGFRAGYLNHGTLAGFFRYTTGDAQLYIDNEFVGNNAVYSDINFRNKTTGGVLTNRMKIKGSTGNVGIGTTGPLARLHVDSTSFPQVRINDEINGGESGIRLRSKDTDAVDLHGDIFVDGTGDETGRMGFRVPWNGSEKLTLLSSGNVGIGSTSPGSTLDVNGNITASSVISSKHHKYWTTSGISNSYVKILQVGTNNGQLASSYTISGVSHGNGHVGQFIAKILVNHHQDVSIYSTCGGYTVGTFKVESGSNGAHHLSFKSNASSAAIYYFHVEGHSDSSTFTTNPTNTPNTSTTHEHLMHHGTNATATGFTPLYKFNETLQAKVLRSDGDVIAYYSSDKRLKDNIIPIKGAIGKIKQLGGYEFDWNDKQKTFEGHDYGVLAQEVEKVLPELVKDREDGYKGVRYEKLASVLIEGIKEQQTIIENQQKQIDELKDLVGSLIKK